MGLEENSHLPQIFSPAIGVLGDRQAFDLPDLDSLYYGQFEELWESGKVEADPSGWVDTYSEASRHFPEVIVEPRALGRYYLDEGDNLEPYKRRIVDLISSWENRKITSEEVTLYNSVSTASAATLALLHRRGYRDVIFETPAYPVTVNQAHFFGLRAHLVPTYHRSRYQFVIPRGYMKKGTPYVVWITQPRMSLGFNQDIDNLRQTLDSLQAEDVLVIDEATEQLYPSLTSDPLLNAGRSGPQVIRLRGLLKGLGLNGVRIAAVLHQPQLREAYESVQEILGASLDFYSLRAIEEIALRPDLFRLMLRASSQQARSLRMEAERIAVGSPIQVARLENGYMGSLAVPLRIYGNTRSRSQEALFCVLKKAGIPVIPGSCMFFAVDPQWEHIRLNFFSHRKHVTRTLSAIRESLL